MNYNLAINECLLNVIWCLIIPAKCFRCQQSWFHCTVTELLAAKVCICSSIIEEDWRDKFLTFCLSVLVFKLSLGEEREVQVRSTQIEAWKCCGGWGIECWSQTCAGRVLQDDRQGGGRALWAAAGELIEIILKSYAKQDWVSFIRNERVDKRWSAA